MYHPQLAIFALSLCTTRNWPFFSLGGIRGVQHRNMSPRGFMHVLSQRKEVGRVVHRNMSPRGLTHVLSTGVPSRAATCARPWLRGALLDRWLLAGRALSLSRARALRPPAVAAGTVLTSCRVRCCCSGTRGVRGAAADLLAGPVPHPWLAHSAS
jgi:hypothetical protein